MAHGSGSWRMAQGSGPVAETGARGLDQNLGPTATWEPGAGPTSHEPRAMSLEPETVRT